MGVRAEDVRIALDGLQQLARLRPVGLLHHLGDRREILAGLAGAADGPQAGGVGRVERHATAVGLRHDRAQRGGRSIREHQALGEEHDRLAPGGGLQPVHEREDRVERRHALLVALERLLRLEHRRLEPQEIVVGGRGAAIGDARAAQRFLAAGHLETRGLGRERTGDGRRASADRRVAVRRADGQQRLAQRAQPLAVGLRSERRRCRVQHGVEGLACRPGILAERQQRLQDLVDAVDAHAPAGSRPLQPVHGRLVRRAARLRRESVEQEGDEQRVLVRRGRGRSGRRCRRSGVLGDARSTHRVDEPKREDLLRGTVLEQLDLARLQVAHETALLVAHDEVDGDARGGDADGRSAGGRGGRYATLTRRGGVDCADAIVPAGGGEQQDPALSAHRGLRGESARVMLLR